MHTDGTSFLDLDGSSITGGNVTNAGTVYSTGLSAIDATITNTNSIEVGTGTLTLSGSISGTGGSATIDGGATLELNLADGQGVNFNGTGAELIIDGTAAHGQTAQSFTGDIHGLAATDEIDLRGISYGNPTYATYTYSPTTGVLSVNDGNGDHYDLDIGPGFAGAHFAGSDDTQGGTLITMNAADNAPAFAQTTLTASFSEQSNQTDLGTPDPVAPQIGKRHAQFYGRRSNRPPDRVDRERRPERDLDQRDRRRSLQFAVGPAEGRARASAVAHGGERQSQQRRGRLELFDR